VPRKEFTSFSVGKRFLTGTMKNFIFIFLHRPLRGISALASLRTGAAPLRACLSLRSPYILTLRKHATEATKVAAVGRRTVGAISAPRAVGEAAPAAAPQHAVCA